MMDWTEDPIEEQVHENAPKIEHDVFELAARTDALDLKYGFERYSQGEARIGWLINIHSTVVSDSVTPQGRSAVDLYFLQDDGDYFKCTLVFNPYFFVACKPGTEVDVEEYLKRRFKDSIFSIDHVSREDLSLPNHLMGNKRNLLKLSFLNEFYFQTVRRQIINVIDSQLKNQSSYSDYPYPCLIKNCCNTSEYKASY
jgi:DNA polymerase epsilon subunit 1